MKNKISLLAAVLFLCGCNFSSSTNKEKNENYIDTSTQNITRNRDDSIRECPETLFKGSNIFLRNESAKPITKLGVCFYKYVICYEEYKITGFWGIINDTVFFVTEDNMSFSKPEKVPMLALRAEVGSSYEYESCVQASDSFKLIGNLVQVKTLGKRIINADTVFSITHTALPNITDVSDQIERRFLFSTKRGILQFVQKQIGDTSKIHFWW